MYTHKQGTYQGPNSGYQYKGAQDRNGQFERRLSKEEKKKLRCNHCKESGHEMHECFKLHGYPEWYKRYKDNRGKLKINYVDNTQEDDVHSKDGEKMEHKQQAYPMMQADMASLIQAEVAKCIGNLGNSGTFGSTSRSDVNLVHEGKGSGSRGFYDGHYAFSIVPSMVKSVWIVDSGASTHVCCSPELLYTTYRLERPAIVHLPDGATKQVVTAGKVRINRDIVLSDVLYVPGFTHNLLSIAQLIQENEVRCTFYQTHCVFQKGNTNQVIGIGKMERNMYIMDAVEENHFCHFFRTKDMTLEKWHSFLGHPSWSTLQHMKHLRGTFKQDMIEALQNCEICMRAKQVRDSFPILNRRAASLFELVHADVWGPYGEENVCNTHFVLTLVVDHSRMIWTYLLSSKELVCSILEAFIHMVKNQFLKDIKCFRTDNGSEFINRRVRQLFFNHGIIHQRTCIYTPQQNGIVERRHRTLLESARAMMFQSSLPLKFWPYSILTATWMLNRIPSRVLNWKSPYEAFFGKEPDFQMLRPFGCLAFAVNLVSHRSKFYSRTLKCIFLGIDAFHKGYILYDMDNSKVIISRDVKFDTYTFPYASDSSIITPLPSDSQLPVFENCAQEEQIDLDVGITDDVSESIPVDLNADTPASLSLNDDAIVQEHQVITRETRNRKPPKWMEDYVGHVSFSESLYEPVE